MTTFTPTKRCNQAVEKLAAQQHEPDNREKKVNEIKEIVPHINFKRVESDGLLDMVDWINNEHESLAIIYNSLEETKKNFEEQQKEVKTKIEEIQTALNNNTKANTQYETDTKNENFI
jgi:hypothetical protein